jgi:hypothetical protein
MTDTRDTVLAYFKEGTGSKTIRFVKRNGSFFMKGDIDHIGKDGIIKNYEDRIITTRENIIEKTRIAFEQTMIGEKDCREIWINSSFYSILWSKN